MELSSLLCSAGVDACSPSTIEDFSYFNAWRSLKHIQKSGKIAPLCPPRDVTLLLREAFLFLDQGETGGVFRILSRPAEPLPRGLPCHWYDRQQVLL